ncbi:MAG: SMP-30/gluconolactonase/LRE family protein [Rhodobacteraceae bacterium]|nr:SMP-30/gluconolactonase/LRE family protein [Paracoccaceae bacterium]
MTKLTTCAEGFSWPEAPRWHDGALWISDVHNFRIARVRCGGTPETMLTVEERPAGMAFTPEGDLLYATSLAARIYRWREGGSPELLFDLGDTLSGNFNDMITGPDGWSWVGETGFTFGQDDPVERGRIHAFHPERGCRIVAEGVFFPNGMAVVGDRLIVCETFGKRLSSFRIGADGALDDRRVLAELPGHPDGLCRDAKGRFWVPLLFEERFACLSEAGEMLSDIAVPGRMAIACASQDQTLFLCMAAVDKQPGGLLLRVGSILTTLAE